MIPELGVHMEWKKNSVPYHTYQQEMGMTPKGQTSNFTNDSALQRSRSLNCNSQKFSRTNIDIDIPLL